MKIGTNPPASEGGKSLSFNGIDFAKHLISTKIKFNPRPFQNKEGSTDQSNTNSYEEVAKNVDDSLKGYDKGIVAESNTDIFPIDPLIGMEDGLFEPISIVDNEGIASPHPDCTEIQIDDEQIIGIKTVDKKTGFGWKGLGSSRLIFDDVRKEYRYEVIENMC